MEVGMTEESPSAFSFGENEPRTAEAVLPASAPQIPRRTLLQSIIDHNPFYLLSAVCMLAGCIALTNSTSWTSIRLNRLLTLIFTLNIYELLMIGWAIFLIRKRRLLRDGVILLILEAFFLVDVTFLNAEIFSASLRVG